MSPEFGQCDSILSDERANQQETSDLRPSKVLADEDDAATTRPSSGEASERVQRTRLVLRAEIALKDSSSPIRRRGMIRQNSLSLVAFAAGSNISPTGVRSLARGLLSCSRCRPTREKPAAAAAADELNEPPTVELRAASRERQTEGERQRAEGFRCERTVTSLEPGQSFCSSGSRFVSSRLDPCIFRLEMTPQQQQHNVTSSDSVGCLAN